MSGLRPFPALQRALDATDPPGHRAVGWSNLRALAREQLRRGAPIVLDGVARAKEIAECRTVAEEEAAGLLLLVTECTDQELHRSRIESRQRSIPDWDELDWSHVERAMATWEPIDGPDLVLDARASLAHNQVVLDALLASRF